MIGSDNADISYDCNGTPAQKWDLKQETTQVRVTGTDYCLDAGLGEKTNLETELTDSQGPWDNGRKLKIW